MRRALALGAILLLAAQQAPVGPAMPANLRAVPNFQQVRAGYRPSDVRLLDRHGEVIHELRVDQTRRRLEWSPLADISPALQAAVITSEDRRFFEHGGVDGWALLGAALQRVTGGSLRGASTITMQLASMLDPALKRRGGSRSLAQKWRQMRRAREIEASWSKAQILEAYLNLVTFRGELQGAGAAASVLFGKAPHGIDEAEALVLATLLRSPNAGQEALSRRSRALRERQGASVSRQELADAVLQALSAPPGTGPRVALAPHIARRLLRVSASAAPVRSTLDRGLQRFAADTLRRHILELSRQHVRDGAVLVADNATGDVLAYVGGSDDLSTAPYVDGVRARRQAGSALKPFLYALALDRRILTAASLIEDTPLEIPVTGGLYRPQNYDEEFRGLVSVRTALSSSLNIPAVRALGLLGEDDFVHQLRRLGFAGLMESGEYYGPSLALGSAEVSLWEISNAYRTLANGGVGSPLRLTHGDAKDGHRERLYSKEATFLVSDILSDRESRTVTFGLENSLVTKFWTAVKTGTSKDMRDNWCVGYSRRYTVGVWVGNFTGEPMRDVSGVSGAAPVWLEVMRRLHRETPSEPPAPPPGLIKKMVAFPRQAEPQRQEWFVAGTEPRRRDKILAGDQPAILAPVSGTIMAIDPDIPAPRQRVLFEARQSASPARWALDGADLGPASELRLWSPTPGKHVLTLIGEAQRVLDRVTFLVRGQGVRP